MKEKRILLGVIFSTLILLAGLIIKINKAFCFSEEKIVRDISQKYLYLNLVELKKKSDYFNTAVELFYSKKINNFKIKKEISLYCEIFMKDFLKDIQAVKELTDLYVRNHKNAQFGYFSKELNEYLIQLKRSHYYSLKKKIEILKQITTRLGEKLPKLIDIINSTL